MTDNQILMAIGAAIACGVVGVIIYYVMAYLKGSINIELSETSFEPGTTLAGSFTLLARKPIEGNRLFVSLVADETVETREDGKNESRTREIYRDEKTITGKKEFAAGFNESFSFELVVPGGAGSDKGSINPDVGKVLSVLGDMFDIDQRRVKWSLEVRLDAKGVDLSDSQEVYINMPGRL